MCKDEHLSQLHLKLKKIYLPLTTVLSNSEKPSSDTFFRDIISISILKNRSFEDTSLSRCHGSSWVDIPISGPILDFDEVMEVVSRGNDIYLSSSDSIVAFDDIKTLRTYVFTRDIFSEVSYVPPVHGHRVLMNAKFRIPNSKLLVIPVPDFEKVFMKVYRDTGIQLTCHFEQRKYELHL